MVICTVHCKGHENIVIGIRSRYNDCGVTSTADKRSNSYIRTAEMVCIFAILTSTVSDFYIRAIGMNLYIGKGLFRIIILVTPRVDSYCYLSKQVLEIKIKCIVSRLLHHGGGSSHPVGSW